MHYLKTMPGHRIRAESLWHTLSKSPALRLNNIFKTVALATCLTITETYASPPSEILHYQKNQIANEGFSKIQNDLGFVYSSGSQQYFSFKRQKELMAYVNSQLDFHFNNPYFSEFLTLMHFMKPENVAFNRDGNGLWLYNKKVLDLYPESVDLYRTNTRRLFLRTGEYAGVRDEADLLKIFNLMQQMPEFKNQNLVLWWGKYGKASTNERIKETIHELEVEYRRTTTKVKDLWNEYGRVGLYSIVSIGTLVLLYKFIRNRHNNLRVQRMDRWTVESLDLEPNVKPLKQKITDAVLESNGEAALIQNKGVPTAQQYWIRFKKEFDLLAGALAKIDTEYTAGNISEANKLKDQMVRVGASIIEKLDQNADKEEIAAVVSAIDSLPSRYASNEASLLFMTSGENETEFASFITRYKLGDVFEQLSDIFVKLDVAFRSGNGADATKYKHQYVEVGKKLFESIKTDGETEALVSTFDRLIKSKLNVPIYEFLVAEDDVLPTTFTENYNGGGEQMKRYVPHDPTVRSAEEELEWIEKRIEESRKQREADFKKHGEAISTYIGRRKALVERYNEVKTIRERSKVFKDEIKLFQEINKKYDDPSDQELSWRIRIYADEENELKRASDGAYERITGRKPLKFWR